MSQTTAQADKEKQETADAKKDTIWNNITFLNAANFNFSNEITGSYLGKLNIFAPDVLKSPFGFNAGIMRVKFNYRDTSNSRYERENVLLKPLDSVKQGTKYLRKYNKYTTSRTNTVWSFYFQPMMRLLPWPVEGGEYIVNKHPQSGIYLHGHIELLVNKTNITGNIETLQQDTGVVNSVPDFRYIDFQRNPIIFDRTYLNGYFGVGLTMNVDPFGNNNSRFFFQMTYGITDNFPHWAAQDIESTVVSVIPTRGGTVPISSAPPATPETKRRFLLVRTEFNQLLSKNAQIVIGADVRAMLPRSNPLYATYIGLNVNLDALTSIISDKK